MSDSYQATYDAVRSRISPCDTDNAVRAVISEAFGNVHGVVSGMCESIEQEATRPSVLMRPSLSIDGNQYCALYGDNLQDGVAGFGDTPEAAMRSFDLAWIGRK